MRVTVCQMNDDPRRFTRDWGLLARHVNRETSELVLLPEMPFHYWFAASPEFDPEVWKEAVDAHVKWGKRLSELGSPVVLGSRPVDMEGKRLNEGFVWTARRGARGVHLKSYLPDEGGYYEASWYERGGRRFVPFTVSKWRIGMMICSDLWAAPHARGYGKKGAHLIAVPRATEGATTEKWVAGGKVAAVVSGAFCISSNRVGARGEADFGGCGWVIGPDAQVLGMTSREKPFITAEVDLSESDTAKRTYPRYSLYPD